MALSDIREPLAGEQHHVEYVNPDLKTTTYVFVDRRGIVEISEKMLDTLLRTSGYIRVKS